MSRIWNLEVASLEDVLSIHVALESGGVEKHPRFYAEVPGDPDEEGEGRDRLVVFEEGQVVAGDTDSLGEGEGGVPPDQQGNSNVLSELCHGVLQSKDRGGPVWVVYRLNVPHGFRRRYDQVTAISTSP